MGEVLPPNAEEDLISHAVFTAVEGAAGPAAPTGPGSIQYGIYYAFVSNTPI